MDDDLSRQDTGDESFSGQDDSSLIAPGPHSAKRRAYSVVEKLAHVRRVNNGERPSKVARDIGVPISTLRGWVKTEAKLCSVVTGIFGDQNHVITRKKLRPGDYNFIDLAVYQWVRSQLSQGERLTREGVRQYAQELARRISAQTGESCTFTGCNSWFYRWRKRYGLEVQGLDRELHLAQGDLPDPADPAQGLPDESILQGVAPTHPFPLSDHSGDGGFLSKGEADDPSNSLLSMADSESSLGATVDLSMSACSATSQQASESSSPRLMSAEPHSRMSHSGFAVKQEQGRTSAVLRLEEGLVSQNMMSALAEWSSSSNDSAASDNGEDESDDSDARIDEEESDDEKVVPVLEEVAMMVEAMGLDPGQVYCGCSVVHYWKMVPEILADSEVNINNFIVNCKSSVFLSVNRTSSHRVGLLAVGSDQGEDAQCLSTPEVTYQYESTATLTFRILQLWFHNQFVPEVQCHLSSCGLPPKALLLVEGGAVQGLPCRHPQLVSRDRQVRALVLDSPVVGQLHPFLASAPLDLRCHYHRRLLEEAQGQGQITAVDFLQSVTLTNMLLRLVKAWRAICPTSDPGPHSRGLVAK